MKKRTHLHTNFIKFIVEKYKKETQELPDEEAKVSNKEIADEFDEILNDKKVPKSKSKPVESQDEPEDEDDENVDTLLKEYLALEKKYKIIRNDNLFKRK
jgi:hypothetical protein